MVSNTAVAAPHVIFCKGFGLFVFSPIFSESLGRYAVINTYCTYKHILYLSRETPTTIVNVPNSHKKMAATEDPAIQYNHTCSELSSSLQ